MLCPAMPRIGLSFEIAAIPPSASQPSLCSQPRDFSFQLLYSNSTVNLIPRNAPTPLKPKLQADASFLSIQQVNFSERRIRGDFISHYQHVRSVLLINDGSFVQRQGYSHHRSRKWDRASNSHQVVRSRRGMRFTRRQSLFSD